MVVNLCLPHFQTSVTCNKLCADGFDVSNLVSRDPGLRKRGFRLEYFLRPPVHVTLGFWCQVEVCGVDVELWPCGRDQGQASRRVEVHTSSAPLPQQCHEGRPDGPGDFILVGRCDMKSEIRACFRQLRFRPRPPFPEAPPDPQDGVQVSELSSRGLSLGCIRQLRVSIPYAGVSSAVGFKTLAVWGVPSCSCPVEILEEFKRTHYSSLAPTRPPESAGGRSSGSNGSPARSDVSFPEEFLDPLTQELMVLPMILPSGAVVDHSTLEEYQRQEATWGRLPNDPFTGVPFTADSKPLPNPLLKSRIDSLILKTGRAGTSVSSGDAFRKPLPSRLLIPVRSGASVPATPQRDRVVPEGHECSSERGGLGWTETRSLKRKSGVHLDRLHGGEEEAPPTQAQCSKKVCGGNVGPPSAAAASRQSSHEQRLSTSLDEALSCALQGRPRYTNPIHTHTGWNGRGQKRMPDEILPIIGIISRYATGLCLVLFQERVDVDSAPSPSLHIPQAPLPTPCPAGTSSAARACTAKARPAPELHRSPVPPAAPPPLAVASRGCTSDTSCRDVPRLLAAVIVVIVVTTCSLKRFL
ncbi:RING finger protein 37 isoform X2 [Denticeps clupeoides]|uniref:RING finger protein 37 isoform X2 n=1 Tax=Denticeps clupeoides TaxID=299321 RepID=UPI0010A35F43|nr:RING finger protein 37 isoform X2 [Denticeps clupeoides]